MNPSFIKVRKMAKERKITIKTTIRRADRGEKLYFPSFSALAKSVERNIGSVLYYEKTKKPMPVVGPGLAVPPGMYIVEKV